MKYTENYKLCKPEETDFYSVDNFNKNMDKIDAELNGIAQEVETAKVELEEITEDMIDEWYGSSAPATDVSQLGVVLRAGMYRDTIRSSESILIKESEV